jgi:RNA polymerase primary sigma factor
VNSTNSICQQALRDLGREPTSNELTQEMGITPYKVLEIQQYDREPISLEASLGEQDDSHLGEFLEDPSALVAMGAVSVTLLAAEQLRGAGTLSECEIYVVRLRFGLTDGQLRTLQEISQLYQMTPARIQQIESTTLAKLRHLSRSQALRDYFH